VVAVHLQVEWLYRLHLDGLLWKIRCRPVLLEASLDLIGKLSTWAQDLAIRIARPWPQPRPLAAEMIMHDQTICQPDDPRRANALRILLLSTGANVPKKRGTFKPQNSRC